MQHPPGYVGGPGAGAPLAPGYGGPHPPGYVGGGGAAGGGGGGSGGASRVPRAADYASSRRSGGTGGGGSVAQRAVDEVRQAPALRPYFVSGSREDVTRRLAGKPPDSFFIRASSSGAGVLVLSFVDSKSTKPGSSVRHWYALDRLSRTSAHTCSRPAHPHQHTV